MSYYSANNKLQFQLMDVGNKLFHLSSSTPHILSVLMVCFFCQQISRKRVDTNVINGPLVALFTLRRVLLGTIYAKSIDEQMEKLLTSVQRPPSNAMAKVLHPIIQALKAKKLVKHPDVNVNISVVCCICEIIRIMAPNAPFSRENMKEFFEVLVTSFEKQSSAAGGYRGKMTKVLEIFRKARLPVMMLDVHVEGLVERLFKQFLTSADSNTSDTLLEMEKIMTMIIQESGELALDLKALIITTLGKVNKIDSPVCWQLGERVLLNCAAKLQPRLMDMEAKETIPSLSGTSNLRNNITQKIKVECPEESIDTVQTTDSVNLQGHHIEDGTKRVSSDDPPMPSKSVTEVTGKRKRNNDQVLPFDSGNYSSMAVVCGPVLRVLPKSEYSWTFEDAKKKVSSNDPPMSSNSVTEVTGKRKRDNEQGVPRKVSYSMTHVQGYKMKKINAPILESIFKKHGDIASDCLVKTASVRESILEVVCEVVKRIQTNDVATLISDIDEIETQVLDAEATNVKVAWLRAHLEAIQKRTAAQKRSTLNVKTKASTSLVKRAAKTDLEERRMELRIAQEWFEKAEKCVKVLDLVEMKLNDNFVESEAEKDLWPEQPIL